MSKTELIQELADEVESLKDKVLNTAVKLGAGGAKLKLMEVRSQIEDIQESLSEAYELAEEDEA